MNVGLYVAVARATTRRMTTYRGATAAGVVVNTVFGLILSYVMLAVFAERPTVGGFDAADAVTWVWVTQALLMAVGMFGNDEMAQRIRSGEVAVDLCRPYDFQGWWAAVHYGKAGFYILARGVPPFVAGALVFGVQLPALAMWAAFAVSVAFAVGVAFTWGFILQLTAFWFLDEKGPVLLGWGLAMFLSGMMVPLVLFPPTLGTMVRALPFAGMIQSPVEVFLGKHTGAALAGVYAHQLVWLLLLLIVGRALQSYAVRRVVIQGG